ncbi:hypothetical protein C6P45_005176 [Maudiozyma exigua]|uniref:Uncharacterized protein n=1 Tax=Maudiozyma exigua TaxID=34358 RepID=A0A9P7BB28_MAUEX|nr:hypothetical protein C6P45_005176 [Kazachstania exigua]
MDVIEKNDSIILKGTNFKSKPVFSSYRYPKFDRLIRLLKLKYGESISDGQPIKGRENIYWNEVETQKSKPVPIPLQPYYSPFYYSMLLVVGSDDSDTLVLTSPMAENVRDLFGYSTRSRKLFGYRRQSRKEENYDDMLRHIEDEAEFVHLTYNCSIRKMDKGWKGTVHLRERDTVELYVVPKPLEYFPMLFINCSMDNIRSLYDNITTLMISKYIPFEYCPYVFTCVIFRPILFNILNNRVEYRQRLPGIDVTDEEFVMRRREWLSRVARFMVSDCKCRSNTEVLPTVSSTFIYRWQNLEELFFNYNFCNYPFSSPRYTPNHCTCKECSKKTTE